MKNEILLEEKQWYNLIVHLDTQIKEDGIYVRFFPFQFAFRHYPWDRISQAFIRQYQAVAEYGGWGYRNFSLGHGKALNVTGNQGIQLLFNDGSKLLIGTEKPAEAASVLKEFGYLNPYDFV